MASTGVGLLGQVAVGASVSMVENTVNQVIENEGFSNFDIGATIAAGLGWATGGLIGGKGLGANSLRATVKNANTIINRQLIKASEGNITRFGAKQIAKYTAQKLMVRAAVITAVTRYAAGAAVNKYAVVGH